MFDNPGSATGIQWAALERSLLLITPHEQVHGLTTRYSRTPEDTVSAVRADIVILDGNQAGEEFIDTLIFPKVLQTQVRSSIGGGKVLGRLGKGQAKPGQDAPWTLAAASEDDRQKGRDYLAKTAPTPF